MIKAVKTMHSHSTKNIRTAFFLNLGFAMAELIGGILVNSVAILSDALHDLGDSLSLGLAWILDRKSKKPGDKKFTFGYQRFSLLGALINSTVLIVGSIFIIREAVERFVNPEPSNALGMIGFAIAGVIINGLAALKVQHGQTLNERVVFWHMLEDVLGWIAVLVAGIVMLFTDSMYIDPALSVIITLYVLWHVIKRLKETAQIFMMGSPNNISIAEIEEEILKIDRIQSLHHTHLWSLDGEQHVFTSHVKLNSVSNLADLIKVKKELSKIMKHYGFSHSTLELELDEESCRLANTAQQQE